MTAAGGNSYAYDANGNMSTRNGAAITWTSYNLPATLSASGYTASFNYAPDRSRWRQIATYSGSTETTIYVAGLVEKLTTSVRVHWKHRIAVPSGEVQVVRRSDGTNDVFYITTDHLGSTDTVTDAAANVLARESFGAWGARRTANWQDSPSPGEWQQIANTTRRGYTGHEQLDNVLLVHMNGRVYDPAIGRFMSADPYVNGANATQQWNRYGYVGSNPLAYTDPSGFEREDSLPSLIKPVDPSSGLPIGAGGLPEITTTAPRFFNITIYDVVYNESLRNPSTEGGAGGGDSPRKPKPPCKPASSDDVDTDLSLLGALAKVAKDAQGVQPSRDPSQAVAKQAESLGNTVAGRLAPAANAAAANWTRNAKILGWAAYIYAGYEVGDALQSGNYARAAYSAADIVIGAGLVIYLGGAPGLVAAGAYATLGGTEGVVNKAKEKLGICVAN